MSSYMELRHVLPALDRIIDALNETGGPIHYKIREAIDAAREVAQQAREEIEAEDE